MRGAAARTRRRRALNDDKDSTVTGHRNAESTQKEFQRRQTPHPPGGGSAISAGRDVRFQHIWRHQASLGTFPIGIATRSGGPADQTNDRSGLYVALYVAWRGGRKQGAYAMILAASRRFHAIAKGAATAMRQTLDAAGPPMTRAGQSGPLQASGYVPFPPEPRLICVHLRVSAVPMSCRRARSSGVARLCMAVPAGPK